MLAASHLSPEEFDPLIRGDACGRALARCLLHLRACGDCWDLLCRLYPGQGRALLAAEEISRPAAAEPRPRPPEGDAEQVPALLAELRSQPQGARLEGVRRGQRYESLKLAEAVLDVLPTLWHSDPHEAADLAEVALAILARLAERESEFADPQPLYRTLARAWALRANALRVTSDLRGADEAMTVAWQWLEDGGQHLPTVALVTRQTVPLRRDQRRFEEALEWAKEGEALYRQLGNQPLAAWMVVAQSFVLGESGRLEASVQLLEPLMKAGSEPQMGSQIYLAALENLATGYAQLGMAEQAKMLLSEIKTLAMAEASPLLAARIIWLEALIAGAASETATAEALYRRVLHTFLDHDIPYDAALVSLDLAALYLENGQPAEARVFATSMAPIFLARGIHREATAAGLLVAEALERETATLEFLHRAKRYLEHARRDPEYRFEAAGK